MLSNSLFGAHQTQDRIRTYQAHILSYSYLAFLSYPSLSYPVHQTSPLKLHITPLKVSNITLYLPEIYIKVKLLQTQSKQTEGLT